VKIRDLSKKFYINFAKILFVFLFIPQLPLLTETNEKKEDNLSILNQDYLNNLPLNDYIIGPGDELDIIVSRDYPELNTTQIIDGEGTLYVSRLNRIYVAGLSINELNSLLDESYKKFVKFPKVEVKVVSYRPIRVLVEGEVEQPGFITLKGAMTTDSILEVDDEVYSKNYKLTYYFPTLFDAIRESGGVTLFSDLKNIQVIRKNNLSNGGGQIMTTLNFENLLNLGANSQNIRIYDSDIIKIAKSNKPNNLVLRKAILSNLNPRFINVFVTGRVNLPGDTKISKASVLTDAVDMAGGTKALKGPTTFIRFNNDGSIDKRKFAYRRTSKRGSFKNPFLKNGDLIVIGESALTITNEIISEFTSPITGIFSAYGLIKAITD